MSVELFLEDGKEVDVEVPLVERLLRQFEVTLGSEYLDQESFESRMLGSQIPRILTLLLLTKNRPASAIDYRGTCRAD